MKEGVGQIARHTNWTVVLPAIVAAILFYLLVRRGWGRPTAPSQDEAKSPLVSVRETEPLNPITEEKLERNNHV